MSSEALAGVCENLAYAENEELLPSDPKARNLTTFDLIVLCAGMVVNVVGLVIPSQVYLRGGFTPLAVMGACFWGFLLVTVLIVLTGDIGTRYGVPFTVMIRGCFGRKGALVASICRAIVCMTWVGVILFFGTGAINAIIETLTGVSAFWPIFVIFAALQLWNASRNVKSMSRFGWVAVPLLAVALAAMMVWVLKTHNVSLPAVLTHSPIDAEGFSFITVVAIFSGGWLSEAINGSDLSRKSILPEGPNQTYFSRNKKVMLGFAIGFIGTGLVLTVAGLTCAVLIGSADPIEVIKSAFAHNPAVLIFASVTVVAAQWSTNTCANIFPATLITLNAFPRLTFAKATWLVGLVSCLMMPWVFVNYLDYVQMVFSALLAPLLGIMLTDYYLIRRCKLDVEHLYSEKQRDWNVPGMIALAAGLVGGAIFYNFAFFAAFPVSAIVYYILAKREAPIAA